MSIEELHEWWEIAQETCPGLSGWTLVIDTRTKGRAGHCRDGPKEIGISRWALNACDDEVIDLLLHEIAHALCDDPGHGKAWKAMAEKVGAEPTTIYGKRMAACAPPPKYQIICPKCGVIGERHRQSMRLTYRLCMTCGSDGLWWHYLTQEKR